MATLVSLLSCCTCVAHCVLLDVWYVHRQFRDVLRCIVPISGDPSHAHRQDGSQSLQGPYACEDVDRQVAALEQQLRVLEEQWRLLAARNTFLTASLLRQQQFLPRDRREVCTDWLLRASAGFGQASGAQTHKVGHLTGLNPVDVPLCRFFFPRLIKRHRCCAPHHWRCSPSLSLQTCTGGQDADAAAMVSLPELLLRCRGLSAYHGAILAPEAGTLTISTASLHLQVCCKGCAFRRYAESHRSAAATACVGSSQRAMSLSLFVALQAGGRDYM